MHLNCKIDTNLDTILKAGLQNFCSITSSLEKGNYFFYMIFQKKKKKSKLALSWRKHKIKLKFLLFF